MSRLTGDQDSSLPGSPASTSQEGLETGASTSCNRTLKVTLLGSEWRSTKGGLSTINRELAIQLAKYSNVEVCIYLPQCSEEDHRVAAIHNVQLIEAEELRGYEPIDWLTSLPENHHPDCIIGHGLPLGRQVQVIQRQHRCKWIQVAHAAPEDLGMFKGYQDAISRGEEKHLAEIKLCELADQVVAVGPKLADEYSRYLRYCQKDQAVMKLTPSIFSEFSHVKQATEERATFCVLVFGRGDDEDFELKGYDIAAKAIAELNENFYQLMFVGAPPGKEDGVAEKLRQHGISRTQLTMRSFKENREDLANLFCEVDLAIMPSRTEGFGLAALEALSAGLPVLVSGNSGLGDALKKVPHGSNCVVNSEDPKRWAEAIRAVCNKDRDVRLKETKDIRGKYAEEYSWEEQCGRLVEKMMDITFGLLHLRLDCTFERTARPGANVAPPASIHTQGDDKTGYGTEDIPTTEQLMNFIAYKCFKTVDPSKEEEKNGFVDFLERVRRVAILDYHKGSLIITLHCSSLQILEELWEDYCTGHLNQMAQQFLVTEDILEFFGLAEVKLTATLFEEEYRACREYFLRLSGATSNQEDVLVIERHMATPASEEVPSHSMGLQGDVRNENPEVERPLTPVEDAVKRPRSSFSALAKLVYPRLSPKEGIAGLSVDDQQQLTRQEEDKKGKTHLSRAEKQQLWIDRELSDLERKMPRVEPSSLQTFLPHHLNFPTKASSDSGSVAEEKQSKGRSEDEAGFHFLHQKYASLPELFPKDVVLEELRVLPEEIQGLSKAQASESAKRPSSSIDDSSPNKHKMLTGDSEACPTCCTLEHSRHSLVLIQDEAEQQKTEMRKTVETHRQNLQAKRDTIKQLNDARTKLKQQGEDVKRHVQTFTDSLIEVLVKKKQTAIEAVESQTKQSVENLSAETVKIENEIKEIETSLEKAEILLNRSTDIEVVGLKTSFQKLFEGSVQNKTDSHDPGSLPTFTFVQNKNLMEAIKREEIGSLEISCHTKASQSIAEGKGLKEALAGVESKFNLITRDYEKTMRYNENDLVTVEILDEQKRDCEMGVRIQDNKTGQYQISYCPRDQGKYSISIKVNEQHVCGSPYDLLVKAREQAIPFQFKPVSSFGGSGSSVGLFNYPWGVAVSDTDEIAVTDQLNNRVQIFDSSGSYLRSFGRKGSNQGEFYHPNGICFDNNGDIFVADSDNHRIQIFNREGSYKDLLGGKEGLDSQLMCPLGLSLDANGDIIVADSGNKLIKIFTTDGQFVRKIGESGSFSFPVHCVQCDEYFIVSDKGDHSIKVFSREGKLQHKFGHRGEGDGEFDCPRCLSVTKSEHLMVCDGNNHNIQVFELNGRFVGKFGTKGNNLGQLKGPVSVAVLSDGRIVISEWLNNRIQIFE